ncbi:uncharacterized protein LOC129557197 [Moschus berezovskii]|uniref:uncharacterized protein LOC129557197 n=1 Tax=Moschus berezovskii TaxID=68408 RepID=UPI002443E880|nr:uncharacterized protein LOC129557197 [Moschus berezovskii]
MRLLSPRDTQAQTCCEDSCSLLRPAPHAWCELSGAPSAWRQGLSQGQCRPHLGRPTTPVTLVCLLGGGLSGLLYGRSWVLSRLELQLEADRGFGVHELAVLGVSVGEGRHISNHGFLQSRVTPKLEQKGVDLEPEKGSWLCEIKKYDCEDDAVSVARGGAEARAWRAPRGRGGGRSRPGLGASARRLQAALQHFGRGAREPLPRASEPSSPVIGLLGCFGVLVGNIVFLRHLHVLLGCRSCPALDNDLLLLEAPLTGLVAPTAPAHGRPLPQDEGRAYGQLSRGGVRGRRPDRLMLSPRRQSHEQASGVDASLHTQMFNTASVQSPCRGASSPPGVQATCGRLRSWLLSGACPWWECPWCPLLWRSPDAQDSTCRKQKDQGSG